MSGLRVVVIGAGANVCRLHLWGISAIGATVVAVQDADDARARTTAAVLGCAAEPSVEALLKHDADLAVILAPHPFHAELAVACLRAGRHVLVEKPIAVTPAEADLMCAAARATGRRLAVAFQQRTRTEVIKARELISKGALGIVHRVELVSSWPRRSSYFNTAPWRGSWRGEGGGILINQGQHDLDLLCHLAGAPAAVTARTRTMIQPVPTEDTVAALAEWPDGALGSISITSAAADETQRIEITGSTGRLRLRPGRLRLWRNRNDFREYWASDGDPYEAPEQAPTAGWDGTGGTHVELYQNVAAALSEVDPWVASGEDAAQALELAAALIMSGQTQHRVELPVDREAYTTMLSALRANEH
jgi:predicted dehydrogenase